MCVSVTVNGGVGDRLNLNSNIFRFLVRIIYDISITSTLHHARVPIKHYFPVFMDFIKDAR